MIARFRSHHPCEVIEETREFHDTRMEKDHDYAARVGIARHEPLQKLLRRAARFMPELKVYSKQAPMYYNFMTYPYKNLHIEISLGFRWIGLLNPLTGATRPGDSIVMVTLGIPEKIYVGEPPSRKPGSDFTHNGAAS